MYTAAEGNQCDADVSNHWPLLYNLHQWKRCRRKEQGSQESFGVWGPKANSDGEILDEAAASLSPPAARSGGAL